MLKPKRHLIVLLMLAIVVAIGALQIFNRQQANTLALANPVGNVVYLSHGQANNLSIAMSERATQIYNSRHALQADRWFALPFSLNLSPNAKNEQLYAQSLVMSFVAQQMQEANSSEGVALLLGRSPDNTLAHIYVLNRSTAAISSLPLEYDEMAIFYQDWLEQLVSDPIDHGTWQFADDYGAVCKLGAC
jgi:hypothetical protein